jgi:hypothetical protein
MSLENMTPEERDAAALRALFAHPEVGDQAKRLYKKVQPAARFPELETRDQIDASNAELRKQIEKLQEEAQTRDINARRAENHRIIREQGLDPDAVEKVMTEEKIGSYDTAIKYMKAQNTNSTPTPGQRMPLQMPDDYKEIAKNPRGWANKKAHEAINDLIAKRQTG